MNASQPDLFGAPAPPPIPGLALSGELVTRAEERELTARIDAAGLAPFAFQGWLGKRLTVSFGSAYDFNRGAVTEAPPIPDWLHPLRRRMADWAGLPAEQFGQALLIRYDPGAAIGWHRDRPQYGTVLGLSLGAVAEMRLRRRIDGGGFERARLPLPPRVAYRLEDEARWDWEHSIAPLDQTRWSVTFRTLRDAAGG